MVTLRHFTAEDAKSIRENLYPDMRENEIADMIGEWNSCVCQGKYFETFAIVYEGRIVGYASLLERSRSIASAGIEIYQSQRKKGFASEALGMLMDYAAKKGYQIILDQIRADNRASIRLHEKLGFESDGYVYRNQKDHEIVLYLKRL